VLATSFLSSLKSFALSTFLSFSIPAGQAKHPALGTAVHMWGLDPISLSFQLGGNLPRLIESMRLTKRLVVRVQVAA
jgi:hypothetical protein